LGGEILPGRERRARGKWGKNGRGGLSQGQQKNERRVGRKVKKGSDRKKAEGKKPNMGCKDHFTVKIECRPERLGSDSHPSDPNVRQLKLSGGDPTGSQGVNGQHSHAVLSGGGKKKGRFSRRSAQKKNWGISRCILRVNYTSCLGPKKKRRKADEVGKQGRGDEEEVREQEKATKLRKAEAGLKRQNQHSLMASREKPSYTKAILRKGEG